MKQSHTPGPWTDQSIDHSQWGVYDARGRVVAQAQQIKPLPEDLKQVERTANARLIAAAPELLEALEEAENALADYVQTIEKTGASLNYGRAVLLRARAAIAKAEGRTE
jgi:hypothetical protein